MTDTAARKSLPRKQRLQLQVVGSGSDREVWESDRRLRVGRLDLMRRRATVSESVTLVRGVQIWGTQKPRMPGGAAPPLPG